MLVVEFSPGGSDDGSGVVILLEILSNLVNDPIITFSQVHLIVLFTSAEEMSLRGAEAFVAEHQWKNDTAPKVKKHPWFSVAESDSIGTFLKLFEIDVF